jgi:hypothetical protein
MEDQNFNWLAKGWAGLNDTPTPTEQVAQEKAERHMESEQAESEVQKMALVTCFRGAYGIAALRYLRDKTIEQPCFNPEVKGENAIYYGFFREGQNSIIREIERLVKDAEKE